VLSSPWLVICSVIIAVWSLSGLARVVRRHVSLTQQWFMQPGVSWAAGRRFISWLDRPPPLPDPIGLYRHWQLRITQSVWEPVVAWFLLWGLSLLCADLADSGSTWWMVQTLCSPMYLLLFSIFSHWLSTLVDFLLSLLMVDRHAPCPVVVPYAYSRVWVLPASSRRGRGDSPIRAPVIITHPSIPSPWVWGI